MITVYPEHTPKTPVHIHILQAGNSHAYLIESETGLVMVDAGWPGNEQTILDALQNIGRTEMQ